MSICLLCYAFPFHVSAITLARSELYPLSDLSCSYVSFLFFLPPPFLLLCGLFVFYFSLSIFDVSLPLCYRGFPPLGLCLRVMEVRIVMRFFFPYTPWAGILRKNFALCLSYPYLFPVKTDCRLVQHVFLSCASAFVDSKFLVIVCNNVLYARLVFALRYCRQALHLLVLYSWPFASGSTYINIAPVAGPIGGGPNELEQTWLLGNWSLVVVLLY
ncbi:unnamed protein product [Penicillium nalgiovense]|uniref:Uncharacterized protein n=1 Tax=Penicillium nalgiovense TaxID=60175 RepID=A0A9W4MK94_PENNA|nr:unnamed protein product [Penicillium nalgiovense]CAG7952300.1 unnamed protein product [Penicillium nalgiovense]CAG7953370.1 unnamed protein product [Penicillium nalgiovense]CAG7954461.1 unnamed protein product [Penicillium nalgiovense]CAG7954851.1 unnamed protein product [Penicillium nalgiovense]